MAIGQHYILTDIQSYGGVQVLNVYAYAQEEGLGGAAELNQAFADIVLPLMVTLQSTGIGHDRLFTYCVEDPEDFNDDPVAVAGTIAGDDMGPFVAYKIKLARASRQSRNGWKRIGGMPEIGQVSGALVSAYATALDNLADLLAGSLTADDDSLFVPKIWRRATLAEPVPQFFGIASGVASHQTTTQNTRKFGRGA
jgi:hypothetical protein